MKIGNTASVVVAEAVEPELEFDTPEYTAPVARSSKPVPTVPVKYAGLPPFAAEAECARTSEFPHAKFACEWFNPLQTKFLPEVEKDNNVIVSGRTSSGKTVVGEMGMAYTLGAFRQQHPYATVAYIAPLKALATEKVQDWTNPNHWFSQYNTSILTGDYILTDERKAELEAADIIIMSSEMLGSRIRRNNAEKNYWLGRISLLVIDEAHLLTIGDDESGGSGRGANLEVALMKFTKVNPNCRIVFLSATMPNIDNIGEWLTKLNNKPTTIVHSEYRPVQLDIHHEFFPWYPSNSAYKLNEAAKVYKTVTLVNQYPEDKFLVFVHGKKTGRMVVEALTNAGVTCKFHNADASKDARESMEQSFKSRDAGSLRVLVATSTLAWGTNQPARRVIIVGLHRGIKYVEPLDIVQECGRSGRVSLDVKGDAHILIRRCETDTRYQQQDIAFCTTIQPIISKIGSEDAVAFHLVSEIAEGAVYDIDTACTWYSRTLAHHQKLLGDDEAKIRELIVNVLRKLLQCGAIIKSPDQKTVAATAIGKIASWFYFNPYNVGDWTSNLRKIVEDAKVPNMKDLAWALGNVYTNIREFQSKDPEIASFTRNFDKMVHGGADRHCHVLHTMLTDTPPKSAELGALAGAYRMDSDRMCAAISMLSSIGGYFNNARHSHVIYELPYRLKYGVDKGLELVILPGVGKKTAEHIMSRRIYSCKELMIAQASAVPVMKADKWEKVKHEVHEIARMGHIEYLKRKHARNHRG